MQSNPSRKTLWFVLGGVGAVLGCACLGVALIFGAGIITTLRQVRSSGDPDYISQATPTALSGGAWKRVEGLPRRVNSFVPLAADPNTVFAATGSLGEGGGVFKSEDGGTTWRRIGNGLPDDVVAGLAVEASGSVLYANSGADAEIYLSRDGGRNWAKAGDNPFLCCNVKRSLVLDPRDHQVVFVLQPAADPNLSVSRDGGKTWQKIEHPQLELQPNVMVFAADFPNIVFLGTQNHGVLKSSDGGMTWQEANRGMVDEAVSVLTADPRTPGVYYAGTRTGRLFKTTDNAETWVELNANIPTSWFGPAEILGVFVNAFRDEVEVCRPGLMMASRDGGQSWGWYKMIEPAPPAWLDQVCGAGGKDGGLILTAPENGAWRMVP